MPIFVKRDKAYYDKLLNQVNGVLMPGGSTSLLHTGYSEAADLIFQVAIDKFNAGIHFPVWGTCLSFQKVVTYFMGNQNTKWLSRCNVQNVSLNLDLGESISTKTVRMFQGDDHIVQLLTNFNVTAHNHLYCLKVSTFKGNHNLTEQFTLVSTNTYGNAHFVSTIEHKKYPIYGTAWHPEKPQFEWVPSPYMAHLNHDWNSVQVGQHFGNFLVNEARKNGQHFTNTTEEAEALIYNYSHNLKYSGKEGQGSFAEIYVWPL